MRHKILRKFLSILILFIILSQSLIPIILANNQVEEKIENSINENETKLENLIEIEEDNNTTNNIVNNETLDNEIIENIESSEENIEEKEVVDNNTDINNENTQQEETINLEEDVSAVLNASARSAGGVATISNTTYFDSEYRLVF